MESYTVRHLSGNSFVRNWSLRNPHYKEYEKPGLLSHVDPAIKDFHHSLPDYNETELHSLVSVAEELGLAHVFMKDESTRFGLPAFKILGASWACHRAICQRVNLPTTTKMDEVRKTLRFVALAGEPIQLVTCSEGNWGRAVARMSTIVGVPCAVYVSGLMSQYTRALLREEGAEVRVVQDGSYDDAIAAAQEHARHSGALLVMDTSWDGYEQIPQWVTDGYRTMLSETDRQVATRTGEKAANVFVVSVGVGSWAHSVVSHYREASIENRIVTVEPSSAASLKESLECGQIVPIITGSTIMAGMNCGTTSKIAWPVLKDGVYASLTITDLESHEDVQFLRKQNINAGPCGAATLAALRKFVKNIDKEERRNMTVVLFSTEGWRQYETPDCV